MSTTADAAPAADDALRVRVEGATAAGLGAALVGRVVGAGDHAGTLLDARVVTGTARACGVCEVCRRGGPAVCPAAPAPGPRPRPGDEVVVAARWALALTDALAHPSLAGPNAALVAGAAATAYALYARLGVEPREPTIVVGGDPVARCLVEILVAKGAPPVVVDAGPLAAAAAARELVVVAPDDDGGAALARALDARGLAARPRRVFVTSPAAAARRLALDLAGPRATVTAWAPAGDGAPVDGAALIAALGREVVVAGVVDVHPDLLLEVAALVIRGDLDLAAAARGPGDDDPSRAVVDA